MKLNLSATEGRKMLCALRDLAIERGWNEGELEESGVLVEYGAAIDAAMNAIGLSIEINSDEEDEEDNFDFDFDDEEDEEEEMESIIYDCDGRRGISASDARLLMRCVADVMHNQFGYLPDEVIDILIQNETMRIASEWNIEVVDMDE